VLIASIGDDSDHRTRLQEVPFGDSLVKLHEALQDEEIYKGTRLAKHVQIHEDRLAFVDLDGMRMGHSAYYIGHFLSALYYVEEGGRFDATVRSTCVRRFLEGLPVGS